LIPLQSDINNHEADSAKAASLISSDVGFENSIHQDLNKYAAGIGISVTSISPIQPPSFESTVASIAGIEPEYVSITIGNPIQFTKLLEFIQAVETNIPKMRITGIDITNDANQDGSVTVKPITVEVYTE
ncbi:MAG TPA: hypothetical protein VMR16_03665, partial [Candidatus Saccharimonadales bacterium]|nr:hypothetical protein [Candidatus Saccharimonadales bacterium]